MARSESWTEVGGQGIPSHEFPVLRRHCKPTTLGDTLQKLVMASPWGSYQRSKVHDYWVRKRVEDHRDRCETWVIRGESVHKCPILRRHKNLLDWKTDNRKRVLLERFCFVSVLQKWQMGAGYSRHFAALWEGTKQQNLYLQLLQQPSGVLDTAHGKGIYETAQELPTLSNCTCSWRFGWSHRRPFRGSLASK